MRSADPIGRRNYAMFMLSHASGFVRRRRSPYSSTTSTGVPATILIRGKGKLHDRMPLPEDVGNAIVDYIRNGRARHSRTLFVSATSRIGPLERCDPQLVLKDAFERTGLKPPQKYVGSHLLRHSLATDMLRKGASLDEIGDVLRHRSRMTTTIYARHDVDGLRSIARTGQSEGDRAQGART